MFFNRMVASSTDSGMPTVIKGLEKTIHLTAIQVDKCCPTLGMSMSLIGVAFHLDFLAASFDISFLFAGF